MPDAPDSSPLPAGPELDTAVARVIDAPLTHTWWMMKNNYHGYKLVFTEERLARQHMKADHTAEWQHPEVSLEPCEMPGPLPYSSDIAAAWTLRDWLIEQGCWVEISNERENAAVGNGPAEWVSIRWLPDGADRRLVVEEVAETVPLALCRAALAWKERQG